MKEPHDNDDKEILLTFSDLVNLTKENKGKIFRWSIVFALLALFYGLSKPIHYEAEATFKEKRKASSNLSNYLSASMAILSDSTQDSDAMTMMHSRKLIEELVKHQGLQAHIVKSEYRFPWIPFETIKNNLKVERALFKNTPFPVLQDPSYDLKAVEIAYENEIPAHMLVTVRSDDTFEIVDGKNNTSATGFFGKPFYGQGYTFTLLKLAQDSLAGQEYSLHLMPLSKTAKDLGKQFTIDADKDDKSLIKITHKNRDRKQAADNINILMALYQEHIEKEHNLICQLQTDYLLTRQKDMGYLLETMMEGYAKELSSDLSTTGFATSEKAMEFLAATQQQLKQQLFTLNMEIQRLENAQADPSFDGELFSTRGNLDIFNKIAAEKRSLKHMYDSLNIAIRGFQDSSADFHLAFPTQLAEHEENKQLLEDTSAMIYSLDHNEMPQPNRKLFENPKFIVKEWYNKLVAAKEHFDNNASDIKAFEVWQNCKDGFSCYLSHLNHYLKVNQRNIEERLANQQVPGNAEYQGINLNIAKELYITYTKELSDLESTTNAHSFVLEQIDAPDFEITSLSTTLTDPVSTDMINRASELILKLKDYENRSTKEQERLLADLAIQKGFLKNHLKQSVSLLKLRQDLMRKKIRELQNTNFSLVQEEISILENQLKDYLAAALENLRQEQTLLSQNLAELRLEMASFPQKWSTEQMIEHQMDINKTLVEEISKLVESKNVSNNLEKFQSAPVDIATPPLHPQSPRLLLLTTFGAILGTVFGFVWILGWSVIQGVKAIPETLRAASLHVSGTISRQYCDSIDKTPVLDSDLDTLRRLMTFFIPKNPDGSGRALLLIEGKGPDYAQPLAELLHRKGLKTVIVNLRFGEAATTKEPGMLQYLEGSAAQPTIIHNERFDTIPAGGICRYANELIGTRRFKELVADLSQRYDWVMIDSTALPTSAEADTLLDLFSCAAITVQNEKVHDLHNAIRHAREPNTKITFVFAK